MTPDLTQWESSRARAEEEGDRIPAWPVYGLHGDVLLREAVETLLIAEDMAKINANSAFMRSHLYRNGQPMVCLQCGQVTDPYGNLPCNH